MPIKGKYRYSVVISGTTTIVSKDVLFSDDAVVQGTQTEGEYFHRERLSANVGFTGATYVAISALTLNDEIIFIVERFDSGAWVERWRGKATKSKGKDTQYGNLIRYTFDTIDRYQAVIDGKAKRFNLIDIARDLVNVSYEKQGLIQIYIEGTNFISSYLSDGVYFENPIDPPVFEAPLSTLTGDFLFQFVTNQYYIPGDATLSPDVSGLYDTTTLQRNDGFYEIVILGTGPGTFYEIQEVGSGTVVYRSNPGESLSLPDPWEPLTDGLNTRATFTSLTDAGSQTRAYATPIYVRLLTDLDNVGGTATTAAPSPDIGGNEFGYDFVYPLTELNDTHFVYSSLNGNTSKTFGRFDPDAVPFANELFLRPANVANQEPQPVGRSDWQPFSLWFVPNATLKTLQQSAGVTIVNKNSYTFDSALQAVINQLDTGVTFLPDSDHSLFLYGTNPIRTNGKFPIVSVKNDVKVGDYDTPARKADISLDDLLLLAATAWRCKMFIDTSNRFRIEHVDYHERGGDYFTDQISTNLSTLIHPDNKRPWEYATNEISYDETALPERMEFRWMDEVSFPFEGYPINFLNNYVQKGNVRDMNVSRFTTDLDFIIANPQAISKDGFVLLECDQVDAINYTVPLLTITVDGTTYIIQNGYASFFYIHESYYLSRLPASDANINNVDRIGITTERRKLQETEAPQVVGDFMELVTTSEGNGLVQEYSENILSGLLKLKLKHGI